MVIAYASRSLRLSQRRYCTTRREMLAAVVMCTHFRSYLQGAQFTIRIDHSSLRWLQNAAIGGPSMPMRMVCPANAASVRGRIARFPRLTRRWPIGMPRRLWRSSLLPHRRWVSPWTQTYCRNCPRTRCWRRSVNGSIMG